TFKLAHGSTKEDLRRFPEFCAVQLNDTHPAMAIPELIRLMMLEGFTFEESFNIAQRTFSYTNHTVMSEALEKWPQDLLASVVPEIEHIICLIDYKLRHDPHLNHDPANFIINNNIIHMANLSIYVGSYVNGVAEIHSRILREDCFRNWYQAFPERFQNKTNGITPRRWIGLCNPELTALIQSEIGGGFLTDVDRLAELKDNIDDDLVTRFNRVKLVKKQQLCDLIWKREHVVLAPHFLFDVQVKRLHEYKRQLLNALSIMAIYFELKAGNLPDFTPTAFLFGAKAAPGYDRAKAIIRYINRIAHLINSDPTMHGKLQVLFVQNYNCSYAEQIIPAADISEQISPAGTEASGTGNMKLMLNGAVTLGTLDGANVEIVQQAGLENNYIFGSTVEELESIRDSYQPRELYDSNPLLRRVVDTLVDGTIKSDAGLAELHTALLDGASWHKADHYFLLKDFTSYLDAKLRANRDYQDRLGFGRKCLKNIAAAGTFSSDRTVRQYAEDIWHI
ncbi:MAG: glycogen/starch/alpha-glucan family phosphorylase, partial [Eubacteriales bacterium]|nr:glycogen/starch/alpha-glucan family phosphorylase [Eubacteriales bacterium]